MSLVYVCVCVCIRMCVSYTSGNESGGNKYEVGIKVLFYVTTKIDLLCIHKIRYGVVKEVGFWADALMALNLRFIAASMTPVCTV